MASRRKCTGALTTALLLAVVLLSWCPIATCAGNPPPQPQDAITVSGTVRDSAGEPVAGASVVLEEKGSASPIEAQTNPDGTFTLSANHAGTFTVRAEKSGLRGGGKEFFVLPAGGKKHFDLILAAATSPGTMEFKDEPSFTVAGVTDWSNVGLHGSDTTSRTSEALANETLKLKPGEPGKSSGRVSAGKYQAALECQAKGDFAQAREQVNRVLATSDDAEGHHLLGDLDERLSDPLEAVREYERAARMYPSEQNYFDWGTELLLHKAAQPAVEVFTKGASLHPGSARMLAGLAAALYAVGSYDAAARRLCQASDLRPADAAPYLFLGQMEKTVLAPLPCAEETLARFAREQPGNALANYYYAVSLWKSQRGSENSATSRQAEALLEKAVRLDPNLAEAHVQLGVLYFGRNDFAPAIQAFQQAIKINPQLGDAHYRLSLAYKRTGEDAKAHQEFEAYQQAEKTETAEVERQRSELKQFLVILKNQPATSNPN
jgi:tetratricopeptide (TPR) repeat protein